MTRISLARACAIGLLLCLGLCGCGDGAMDEEREPHFIRGRSLAMQGDYAGAINSFERALAINPLSSSAHFELAVLFEDHDKGNNPAAAIYHYERYLKLRPHSPRADLVRQEINACKMDLAKTISTVGPPIALEQHDWGSLVAENKRLSEELDKYKKAYDGKESLPLPAAGANPARPASNSTSVSAEVTRTATNHGAVSHSAPSPGKVYTIRPGDTPAGIARRYGISPSSLLAANPGVKATQLLPGHTLNIPGP